MPDYNVWIVTGGLMESPGWQNECLERINAEDPDRAIEEWLLKHKQFASNQHLTRGNNGYGWSSWGWKIHVERVNEPGRLMLSDMTDDELRSVNSRIELELRHRDLLRLKAVREGRVKYRSRGGD